MTISTSETAFTRPNDSLNQRKPTVAIRAVPRPDQTAQAVLTSNRLIAPGCSQRVASRRFQSTNSRMMSSRV
jgi:hypothetical protein